MLIGITGGIGSGKSTIARELARRGYAVYDCDAEAKRIVMENRAVQQAIIELLGEDTFADGKYNTSYVSRRVFAEPTLLQQLNAIVHPAVKADIIAKCQQPIANGLLFVESAILYEAGLDRLCDKVVCIDAPESVRIARTIARDYNGDASPTNTNKVRARIRAQHIRPSSITLINDGSQTIADLATTLLKTITAGK